MRANAAGAELPRCSCGAASGPCDKRLWKRTEEAILASERRDAVAVEQQEKGKRVSCRELPSEKDVEVAVQRIGQDCRCRRSKGKATCARRARPYKQGSARNCERYLPRSRRNHCRDGWPLSFLLMTTRRLQAARAQDQSGSNIRSSMRSPRCVAQRASDQCSKGIGGCGVPVPLTERRPPHGPLASAELSTPTARLG